MKYSEIAKKKNKSAMITGGTSGIGKSFAIELAKENFDLTIVARRQHLLLDVKKELQDKYQVSVNAISADLSKPCWRNQLGLSKIEHDLIINCAGDGYPDEFGSKEIEVDRAILQLNCMTPMELTHEVFPYLKKNGGGIIFVSSTMGYLGIPYMANYSATKSYLINFGEALYHELKDSNVSVEVITPGATRTPGIHKYDVKYEELPITWMNPNEVAKEALKNLGKKSLVVPGWTNWLTSGMSNCILTRGKIQSIMKKYSKRIITIANNS